MRNEVTMLSSALCLLAITIGNAAAADVEHGRRIYKTCISCHAVDSGHSGFGPSLKGVVGRAAASVPDYRYSPAMQAAGANGLVWDEKALAEFLTSPQSKVPGNKMRFWGLWKSQVSDLIAYLQTFKAVTD
jgi:cytochrome c